MDASEPGLSTPLHSERCAVSAESLTTDPVELDCVEDVALSDAAIDSLAALLVDAALQQAGGSDEHSGIRADT